MISRKRKADRGELDHPYEEDEPPFTCKLLFSSFGVYVDLSGWSSLVPIKMGDVNLSSTTCFAELVDKLSGRMHPIAKEWFDSIQLDTIRHTAEYIGFNWNVTTLLIVQVIAKRKVAVVVKNQRIFLIPTLIVADQSGYCILTSMNEGLKVVYNAVEIGDVLMMTRFQPLAPFDPVHKGLFADRRFVNLEIKFPFHSVRSHFHFRFDTEKRTISPYFKMSEALFDDEFRFYLPHELHGVLSAEKSNINSQYFDIVGVISYVGRIERHRVADPITVESSEPKKMICVPKFLMFRWIRVIGNTGDSIPIKIYIYNQSLGDQPMIIPGAHVVISHCIIKEDQFTLWRHVAISEFSHIFLERKISTYFRTRPSHLWDKAKSILGRNGYISVLTRDDIVFSLGGTIQAERVNENKFLRMYKVKERILYNKIENQMKRRESRYLFIKGKIIRAFQITPTKDSRHEYIQVFSDNDHAANNSDVKLCFKNNHHPTVSTWYSFTRKLPQLNQEILSEAKSSIICKCVTEEYGKFCGPLLMPATKTAWGNFDRLADLEIINGQSYIEVDIFNDQSSTEWRCIWKNDGRSNYERIAKIYSSASEVVVCIVEAFCLEQDSAIELSLIDFVNYK